MREVLPHGDDVWLLLSAWRVSGVVPPPAPLARFDGRTGSLTLLHPDPGGPFEALAMAVEPGAVWLGTTAGAFRLDTATGRWRNAAYPAALAAVAPLQPQSIQPTARGVWFAWGAEAALWNPDERQKD